MFRNNKLILCMEKYNPDHVYNRVYNSHHSLYNL